MIDIQPHIDELRALKERMDNKIDSLVLFDVTLDLQLCPDEFYFRNGEPLPSPKTKTFYCYLQSKTKHLPQ
jgi:hypothetical protein